MNKIPKEMLTNSVEHRYGGNGWAVVEPMPNEFCRIANFFQNKEGKWKIGSQFFTVWDKLLKTEGQFPDTDVFAMIQNVREKLASGNWSIQNTRLVKTNP